jgi:hypothetical protein
MPDFSRSKWIGIEWKSLLCFISLLHHSAKLIPKNYFAFLSKLSFVPHLLLSNLVQIFPSHIIVAQWRDKDIKGVFFHSTPIHVEGNREYYKSEKVEFDNIEVRKILIHTLILPSVKVECGRTYFHSVNLGWFCNSLINTSAVISIFNRFTRVFILNANPPFWLLPVWSDDNFTITWSEHTGLLFRCWQRLDRV